MFMGRKSCAKSMPMPGLVKARKKAVRCQRAVGTKVKDIKRQERLTIYSASPKAESYIVNPEVCKYPFSHRCFSFKTVK